MGTTAHSDDLRSRVVEEILAGASRRQAAERFKVSAASAVRWAQLHSQTGGVGPRPRGGKRSGRRPRVLLLDGKFLTIAIAIPVGQSETPLIFS